LLGKAPPSLPGTTSNSTPASTSTIDVDQRWRRRDPSRTNSVSSKPKAVETPRGVVDFEVILGVSRRG